MDLSLADKKNAVQVRNELLKNLREWFGREGFLEVETPILTRFACPEPYLYPLPVSLHDLDGTEHGGYLSLSPEISLKNLLAAGYGRIFEIAKCFRDREYFKSPQHNIEFSLLEWYRAGVDYNQIIGDCKNLLSFITDKLLGADTLTYQQRTYQVKTWREITVQQAFKEWAEIDLDALTHWDELMPIAKERGLNPGRDSNEAFATLFAHYLDQEIIELKEGVVLKDYPACQWALAKPATDKRYVERFEIFFAGLELANGYSELCDSQEMSIRYRNFIAWQKKHLDRDYALDQHFLENLKHLKQAGGVAWGIDRLIMLLTNATSIEEVILFPTRSLFS